MIYNISVVAMLSVLSVFLFVVLANTAIVIYAQKVPTNAQQTPPPLSSSSSITKLQTVKITSPAKGQQVPIGENLTVFGITGTAVGSTGLSHCQVFVIANSVKPCFPFETESGKIVFMVRLAVPVNRRVMRPVDSSRTICVHRSAYLLQ